MTLYRQPATSPESLLLVSVLNQAMKDYKCFLNGTGTSQAMVEGKKVRLWVTERKGTFDLVALASGVDHPEQFRKLCLWKLNHTKRECIAVHCDNLARRKGKFCEQHLNG